VQVAGQRHPLSRRTGCRIGCQHRPPNRTGQPGVRDSALKNVLFVIVVGLLVVPLPVTFIPALMLFRDMDIGGFQLNGTVLAVWLAHTGYGLPFAVFLLRNYMAALPKRSSSPPRSTAPATPPRSSGWPFR